MVTNPSSPNQHPRNKKARPEKHLRAKDSLRQLVGMPLALIFMVARYGRVPISTCLKRRSGKVELALSHYLSGEEWGGVALMLE